MSPEELLDRVDSKETFLKFLDAFISNREKADALETKDPARYQWGGAKDWQNSSISSFLSASRVYFEPGPERHEGANLTWKDLAEFLYFGKIYE